MIKTDQIAKLREQNRQGVENIRKDLATLYRPLLRDLIDAAYRQTTHLDEAAIAPLAFAHANLFLTATNADLPAARRNFRLLVQLYAQKKLPADLFDDINRAVIAELVEVISTRMRTTPSALPNVHFALIDFQQNLDAASAQTEQTAITPPDAL